MAAISRKVAPEQVIPLLSHNVFELGYVAGNQPTEFLILLAGYIRQARELTGLAGPDGALHVSNCDEAKNLLTVLGYRVRGNCGTNDAYLETADPKRAFLTIDSGFPLPDLEESLRGGKAFSYPYTASSVPVLFDENIWVKATNRKDNNSQHLIDVLLNDPSLARLYWAFAHLDPETRSTLQQTAGLDRLSPHSAVLDFYGSHVSIRSGHVLLPGGADAEHAWKDLVGADPQQPGEFVARLMAKDKGWMAAYFDALSRVKRSQQLYFTDSRRLKLFYDALRTADGSEATKGVFRPAPGLLVLVTQLQFDSTGQPLVPGNLEVWKSILAQKISSPVGRNWSQKASHISTPEQMVQTLFGLSRVNSTVGPLQIYLSLCELDSRRSAQQKLSPEVVKMLARKYADYSDQYRIFGEFPELNGSSISAFMETAVRLDAIPNISLRGNALGTYQATVGIWQILARQGQIAKADQNDSFLRTVKPFATVRTAGQVFEAGRTSLSEVMHVAFGKTYASQDEIIELLAGPQQTVVEAKTAHQELAHRMHAIMDGQRLVSLDTLLALGMALDDVAKGKQPDSAVVTLAGQLREFEMPRPIFSRSERTEWAAGVYNNRHTDLQMKATVGRTLKTGSRAEVEDARGQLGLFLRDTLVGLNYAYYEPPGAQLLFHNPLFVRQHDFSGETIVGIEHVWQAASVFGAGSPAGGGAHLVGSLADLPYVLAEAEQDFIAPANVQALIFKELVPGLLTGAVLPRWWEVDRNELHAVALYQKSGEELLTACANDEQLLTKVMSILDDRMSPRVTYAIEARLSNGRAEEILRQITPADTFYLSSEFRIRYPHDSHAWGAASKELEELSQQQPDDVSRERLSEHFGIPHPVLSQSYTRELLNIEPFPPYSGLYSRLLAESWDSSNLYWARVADETNQPPAALHHLVPELTHRMIEKIFASEFEDWPAILRAMHEAGDDFRQGKMTEVQVTSAIPGH
ncbi:MAG TPA: hypothetical protein VLK33_20790 [Terriglobales bacterium]|nr:hypothetical protein [Terriglobales bacterium]